MSRSLDTKVTHHVVLFSGGIGSWAAAQRVKPQPDDRFTLLFTDTKIEDEDLYRWLDEAATSVRGAELVTIADGRDVWELFNDENMIGNTRADICSRVLKRDLARKWIHDNCDPAETIVYMGIDWTEMHRYERAAPRWLPYELKAPLCESPLLSKQEMLAWATDLGLTPPRLYEMGFPHNNCGGFCIKQGHAAFVHLLKVLPDRYAYHEQKERDFRERTGKNVAILRSRKNDETIPLTLEELRLDAELGGDQQEFDWGGCGCMVDD